MSDRRGDDRRGGGRADRGAEFHRVRSAPLPPEPGRRRAFTPPSPRVRRKRTLLLLAGTMSVLVLLASGTAWSLSGWVSGQMNRFDVFGDLADGDRPAAGATGALNFLVIGSDTRDGMDRGRRADLGVGQADGRRSDTMMLVHLNHARDHVTVVGIPRDSWVDIPGHGEDKINAAYSYGGPSLAVQTVESATNVRIDHYVEVDFAGFVDVVDALGGIEVCLPEPINDPKARLDMPAGTHRVDGTEALAFARTRQTAGGDIDRIDRQQQVVAAMLQTALSTDTLTDPQRFGAFLDTALGAVTVDEGLDSAALNDLAGQMRDISLKDVTFAQVPLESTDFWTPRGDVAVTWDTAAAADMFAKISADKPLEGGEDAGSGGGSGGGAGGGDAAPRPEDIEVEVFNGTGIAGLGAQAGTAFTDAGFRVAGTPGNWSSADVAETVLRHGPDHRAEAAVVADSVPGATLEEDPGLGDRVQVVLGFNYQEVRPPEAADAAASPSPSPEAPAGGEGGPATAAETVCAD
ncbi:LCP family protein [Streptomonospora sp. S1-112]|uniref:LCP family protein n=1 Tax=Streptomonospora mangrovi TaxID=2883123 RepID=A0A9X3NM63_9ACTN|nr:LCP family protein [Streptomonospora mangrovi]MDA0565952.1 LCP family protein [Streptomonospora mangrovi]